MRPKLWKALPLLQSVVEQLGGVDHDLVEHPVELLGVDPVRLPDLAVEPGFDGWM